MIDTLVWAFGLTLYHHLFHVAGVPGFEPGNAGIKPGALPLGDTPFAQHCPKIGFICQIYLLIYLVFLVVVEGKWLVDLCPF